MHTWSVLLLNQTFKSICVTFKHPTVSAMNVPALVPVGGEGTVAAVVPEGASVEETEGGMRTLSMT